MLSIDPAIHLGFMGSIWKKRWRAQNSNNERLLFIAFHEKATRSALHSLKRMLVLRIAVNPIQTYTLALTLSQFQKKPTEGKSNDLCSICANGGDLLCCDNCPRAFHTGGPVLMWR